jgi:signal transduction histidine kinase
MIRFLALSVAALVVVGAATVLLSRNIAADEAVRDARKRTEGIARGLASPLLNEAVRDGDPVAVGELTKTLENRMRDRSVRHIELWDPDGEILWADDESLVGQRSELPSEVLDARVGESVAYRPGDREEHPGREEGEESLLEVYVPVVDASGEPFVFEAYIPQEQVAKDYKAILSALLPMSLGSLVLLQLAMVPLSLSLARRVDRADAHRSRILRRSLLSWHEERRRIAQTLHEGVIQDLSAMTYALPAVVDQLPGTPAAAAARDTGRRMEGILVQSLRDLRSMLVDLLPSGLEGNGLPAALDALARRSTRPETKVEVVIADDVDPGPAITGLVYRVVREGLRNAEKHAAATTIVVEVTRHSDRLHATVTDDGRGPSGAGAGEGHIGLRLLEQLVADVGGRVTLSARAGGGAVLRADLPAALPEIDEALDG